MKKLLITAAVSALAFAAAPAAAQTNSQGNAWGNANAQGGAGIQNRIARLDAQIQAGVQSGQIDRTEARSLRQELRTLTRLERQYSRNGLTQQERADLRSRVQNFRQNLRLAGGGNMGNGQYGSQYPNDGNYGQGGPYDPACYDNETSSSGGGLGGGLGGIIDSIFGGGNGNSAENCDTTLRVGQRVSGNLGSVPYHLRTRFRDGNGVYYRSDGRAIYQIDARSHTVVRIYNVD
jgi:hypothetical protein